MHRHTRLALATAAAAALWCAAGCSTLVTKTPQSTEGTRTNFSYTVNQTTSNVVATIGGLGALVPGPIGAAANTAATLALGALALWVAALNRKQTTGQSMIGALISGIENAPPAATVAQVKTSVQAQAQAAGVAPQLAAAVASQTPQPALVPKV